MSRPIDADAVKGLIRSGISVDTYADQDYVCELVDDIPTIDAVEVVRCKDCMWWINNLTEFSADEDFMECRWNEEESPDPDDFCSYGERRENE